MKKKLTKKQERQYDMLNLAIGLAKDEERGWCNTASYVHGVAVEPSCVIGQLAALEGVPFEGTDEASAGLRDIGYDYILQRSLMRTWDNGNNGPGAAREKMARIVDEYFGLI